MFFRLSSLELGLVVFAIVLGTTLVGVVLGRRLRAHADALRGWSASSRPRCSASSRSSWPSA